MRTVTRNVLFMDLSGWSRLSAAEIAGYVARGLPALAALVGAQPGSEHLNTWGDALVATFESSREAAQCALAIRDFFRHATEDQGVPRGLVPRLALHLGEVIIADNPLTGRKDIFGNAVHLAARLEPVTARGQVFCTQPVADALRDVAGLAPAAHDLGDIDLAKGFGRVRAFVVTGPNEDPPPAAARPHKPAARNKTFYFYISHDKLDQLLAGETAPAGPVPYGDPDLILPEQKLRARYAAKLGTYLAGAGTLPRFKWDRAQPQRGKLLTLHAEARVEGDDDPHDMVTLAVTHAPYQLKLDCSMRYFAVHREPDGRLRPGSMLHGFFQRREPAALEIAFYCLGYDKGEFRGSPLFLKVGTRS